MNYGGTESHRRKIIMTGTTPATPQPFTTEDVVKESMDHNTFLYRIGDALFIHTRSDKSKSLKVIRMNDIYAAVLNGIELKLESCPRSNGNSWNPFKKQDQVRFHEFLEISIAHP